MTYQEFEWEVYKTFVERSDDGPNAWRLGQTYFNVLTYANNELADEVRGTNIDPFFVDDRLGTFLEFVRARWSE